MSEVWTSLALLIGAAALVAVGRWGTRNAADLAPSGLDAEDRLHRAQVLRRGVWACFGAAALFVVTAAGVLL